MHAFNSHVRSALRAMRRAPLFTIVAVLCLGTGIGVVTTMGEVLDLLLFRPPPHVRAPEQIVELHYDFVVPGVPARPNAPGALRLGGRYADFLTLRDSVQLFGSVAGYHSDRLSFGRGVEARPVEAAFVTGTYFQMLGVRPALGRFIGADEVDAAQGESPAVISYALWHTRFGADPAVLGRRIPVGRNTYTVVGVAPEGFRGIARLDPRDVWLPVGAAEREYFPDGGVKLAASEWPLSIVGRMRPDVSHAVVESRAAAMRQAAAAARFAQAMGAARAVATLTPIVPGLSGQRSQETSVALWLAGVATIVLLIACANVAGLFLVRAADRQREVAIRLALGATRAQLAQLFLIEGLVLAAAGGLLGIVLREWGGEAIRILFLPQLDAWYGALDSRALALSMVVTVVTGIACGIAPAIHIRRSDIAAAAAGAARSARLRQPHVRAALLTGQVALATTLVAGAALFLSSWRNVRSIRLGFSAQHVLVGTMPLQAIGYTRAEQRSAFERMLDRLRVLPGVRSVSLASHLPFVSRLGNPIEIPGVDPDIIRHASHIPIGPELNVVSPDFFASTGTILAGGRLFDAGDRSGAEPVAIINEKMARAFWPGGNALGKCIAIQPWGPHEGEVPCSRIVGIVANTKTESIRGEPDLQMYASMAQSDEVVPEDLIVRAEGDPGALIGVMRQTMQDAAAGLPFADVKRWSDYLEPELRPWRLGAAMFTLFGSVALGLAAVGLYGVFSYATSRRTREFAVRSVLGARATDLIRMVLADGVRVAVVGLVLGVVLALGLGKVLAAMLEGVASANAILLGAALAVVVAVSLVAVAIPAWQAARVDAAVALRDDGVRHFM